MIPVLVPEHRWHCPSCGLLDVTHEPQPHTRFHSCAALGGLTAPMLPAGVRGEHRVNDREDYLNGDLAQTDQDGRVVMSVSTIREDGIDCTILAPAAVAAVND